MRSAAEPGSPVEYHIKPSEDGRYIVIEVIGDFGRSDALRVSESAFALGAELGISLFLNDVTRARNTEPVMEDVRFARDDAPKLELRDPHARTAVLTDPADHSHDFFVAFAQSQGIDISIFWDRDQAIEYLLGE